VFYPTFDVLEMHFGIVRNPYRSVISSKEIRAELKRIEHVRLSSEELDELVKKITRILEPRII
jgi:hypothetical protein